jgi:hypothetical protein
VSKVVADIEGLSDLIVLQAQFFRSFFLTVAVTTKFSSAGALVFCSCAPVVAKRKTRHLLRKFLFGMRDSNSQMLNCASFLICEIAVARGSLPARAGGKFSQIRLTNYCATNGLFKP